ncbi:MAG: hypothetical protein Q9Q40_08390 [Acidobacteriota bacterium]|nr:hypothetical protein [Acidobacteriota bacterium]MDQ7087752.1 hypothetical protein [Acidobacteriota bacterium]
MRYDDRLPRRSAASSDRFDDPGAPASPRRREFLAERGIDAETPFGAGSDAEAIRVARRGFKRLVCPKGTDDPAWTLML